MSTLVIEGAHRLHGRVDIEGNKNAALPLIAACLLSEEECVLENVPRIADVEVMCRLLLDLGAEIDGIGTTTLNITCKEVLKDEPDRGLVGRLRGSVLLMGPLLARKGRALVAPPGGDFPTRRTIRTHLEALGHMGVRVAEGPGHALEAPDGLQGASYYLDEASVTGTETALLAAAAATGRTVIRHAACEPHVIELCEFLKGMGVAVEGGGSPTITVEGIPRRRGARRTLWGDYIEAGSWAVVGAITGGAIEISGTRWEDMEVVSSVLKKMNVHCEHDGTMYRAEPRTLINAGRVTTGLWPGFPSDLISLVTVLATQAAGATLVHDWLYELRLYSLEQLSGMGADLFLCDPHRIIVTGPRQLRGKELDSRDIRSGMALIAAALAAKGQSRVDQLEVVERGYARLVDRLEALGGHVARVG
ncbi:MAG TPA: UDP-N-acetylglucosamine 1-carboxyvinyltransferase [Vicinamibacterales bacterium]|nr:UDP-N-acetylglucosamine 1-carboxyvinyltransferase [Vicinamibacterales bacterium]